MAALAASGVGPARVVRAVLLVAVLFTVIQGLFSLFLGPWADEQGDQLRLKAQQLTDIQGVVPGRFQELPQGRGVIYIESISQDLSRINNIFVQHQDEVRNSRIVAESGHIERDAKTGDRILILENGHRYEGQPGDEDYTILDFKRHGVRIEEKQVEGVQLRRKAMPTRVLLEPHDHPPEMARIISLVVYCSGIIGGSFEPIIPPAKPVFPYRHRNRILSAVEQYAYCWAYLVTGRAGTSMGRTMVGSSCNRNNCNCIDFTSNRFSAFISKNTVSDSYANP